LLLSAQFAVGFEARLAVVVELAPLLALPLASGLP
jgi:hypothetical protein